MADVSGTVYNSIQENPALKRGDELNADMSSSLGEPRLLRRGGRHIKKGKPASKVSKVKSEKKGNKSASNISEEKSEVRDELDKLEKVTKKEIIEIRAVWPFDFFPDRLIIDLNTVSIIKRRLLSRYVFPVHIEDIKSVRDHWGPFFASIEIDIRGYEKNPPRIDFLSHGDATKARMYINALMDMRREKIELEKLSREEIIKKLEEISQIQSKREPGMM